jgi:acyl carrier protein
MSKAIASDDITAWLVDWIARELTMPAGEIDTARSLLDYSLSSVTATILVGDLEDWLDLRLPPTLVWDYPSIDAITTHLRDQLAGGTAPDGAAPEDTALDDAADAARLLENLDTLSEEEIDALLRRLEAAEAR